MDSVHTTDVIQHVSPPNQNEKIHLLRRRTNRKQTGKSDRLTDILEAT